MPGPLSQLQATYRLVAALVAGKSLDRVSIAKMLDVRVAAADRHINAMLAAIPQLKVERGPGRRRRVRVPALSLGEAPTFPTAVAASLGSGLARLFKGSSYETGLRSALAHVIERVQRRAAFKESERKFLFVTQGGEVALPEKESILHEIVDGLLHQRTLRVRDIGFDGAPRRRTVEPLSLAIYQHQLYVVARERGKLTVIRFARIASAEATAGRFKYPSKAEYDPEAIFRDSLGIFIKGDQAPTKVRFRLDKTWANYALSHRWHESQQVQQDDEGITVTITVRHCLEVEQLLLGFGEHVEVLGPPELKERVEARILAAARKIGERTRA